MKKKKIFGFGLHYSFIVLLIFCFATGQGFLCLLYFLCLLLHEMVHGIVARKRGYQIGKIKLLATGAVLEAESDEFAFNDEIIIALSAPLFNLAVFVFLVALWWIYPESYNHTQDLAVINLAIFAFNILPIFPLDGGRILLAWLSKRLERKTAVRVVRMVTCTLSCLLFLIFVFSIFSKPNFSLGMMSVTLFVSGIADDKNAVYKRALYLSRKFKRATRNGVEVRYVLVFEETPKEKLITLLSARFYTIFVLIDSKFNKVKEVEEKSLFE